MVSDLNILVWKWSKIAAQKKEVFFADFALQNVVETTLPDGLETSGQSNSNFFSSVGPLLWIIFINDIQVDLESYYYPLYSSSKLTY